MSDTRVRILLSILGATLALALLAIVLLVTGDDDASVATDVTSTTTDDDADPTSTTTSTASTTTQPRPVPTIVAGGYVMGFWDGDRWRSLTEEDGGGPLPPSPVEGGESFRFVTADGTTLTAALPTIEDGCYLGTSHGFADPSLGDLVGLPEGEELLPRDVRTEAPAPDHVAAVEAWLEAEGVPDPEALIDRVLRVDLDGDGTDEVFIEASRNADGGFTGEPGGYSVVLYRDLDADDQVQTVVVAGDWVSQDEVDSEFGIVFVHRILAVADLSGDGIFELVTRSSYYEGEGVEVVTVDGTELTTVLSTGCGA